MRLNYINAVTLKNNYLNVQIKMIPNNVWMNY